MSDNKSTIDFLALYPEFTLSGGLREGTAPIKIKALANKLAPGLPSPPDNLEITQFFFSANPKYKRFEIEGEVVNLWSLDLGSLGSFSIESLYLYLNYSPQATEMLFRGELDIIGKHFILEAENRREKSGRQTSSEWIFRGALAEGDVISITDLVKETLDLDGTDLGDYGFSELQINQLGFETQTGANTTAKFYAGLLWDTGVSFDAGENLIIESAVLIEKDASGYSGQIGGKVQASIPFFENLEMEAIYAFEQDNNKLDFKLQLGILAFNATFEDEEGDKELTFTLEGSELPSFGEILAGMIQLIDPTEDDFALDYPWNLLNEIELSDLTDNLSVIVNLSTRSVSLDYNGSLSPAAFESFGINITGFSLNYSRPKNQKSSISLGFGGDIFGQSIPAFDPMGDGPPEVAGASVFSINYLGLGQHVSLRPEVQSQLESINQFIDAYKSDMLPVPPDERSKVALPDGGAVIFNKESGWLIGAQLELIKTIKMSVIFNDPYVYGLRLELAGPGAKAFSGLKFEILYVRISDTIGKYHVDLTLPDLFRYLQFGAVSVTLPIIVIDIYTNGDFKLDLGFPYNLNFARSFAIEVFPFTGAGGFYFNKLSAATATSTPPTEVGIFDPVIEFGIGLKVGLGKTFNKGPLKAEISITVQGMLEGVISWFEPSEGGDKVDYFYIKGAVAIVGRVYGAVDFKVIKVEVEILARAMVQFVVESYRASLLVLSAEVSVKASVKIAFIKVKFSFSLEIVQRFTIGSDSIAPWDRKTKSIAPARRSARTFASRGILPASILDWNKNEVLDSPESIKLYFQPAVTKDKNGVQGIGFLYIQNSIPFTEDNPETFKGHANETKSDFDKLALAAIHWAIVASLQPTNPSDTSLNVTLQNLKDLYEDLLDAESQAPAAFDYEELLRFIKVNFNIEICDCKEETSVSAFPMFSEFAMNVNAGPDIDFTSFTVSDVNTYQNHFQDLQVQLEGSEAGDVQLANNNQRALTDYLLMDYIGMVIRMGIQDLIDNWESESFGMEESEIAPLTLEKLLDFLNEEGSLNHIAGMASRFLLHGLRLPKDDAGTEIEGLYVLSGQQFSITDLSSKPKVNLKKLEEDELTNLPEDLRSLDWITLVDDGTGGAAEGELLYEFSDELMSFASDINGSISLDSPVPNLLDFFAPENLHFPIQQASKWEAFLNSTTSNKTLFTLPNSLQSYLREQADSQSLELIISEVSDDGKSLVPISTSFTANWATQISLKIKRTSDQDTGIYELVGVDEYAKDVLESFLPDKLNGEIVLAYSQEKNVLKNVEPSACFILKTNLSTETHASRNIGSRTRSLDIPQISSTEFISASMLGSDTNRSEFIRLIWEASTVNTGGFYLYYEESPNVFLPDEIFEDGTNATLSLILHAAHDNEAEKYSSCLILDGEWDNKEFDIRVESSETYQVQLVPTGHIDLNVAIDNYSDKLELAKIVEDDGATLKSDPASDTGTSLEKDTLLRVLTKSEDGSHCQVSLLSNPETSGWVAESSIEMTATAKDKLQNLYQLLGYQVKEKTNTFTKSTEALPAGPKDSNDQWSYEMAIPYFNFADNSINNFVSPPNSAAQLPPKEKNPYAGIGHQIDLEFYWQDLYGNRLADSEKWNNPYDLSYNDPIIGINQWPNVKEQFHLETASANQAKVVLSFGFDITSYQEGAASIQSLLDKCTAARTRYQQIFYQMRDGDIGAEVEQSITTSANYQLTEADINTLREFVDGIYLYLDSWIATLTIQTPTASLDSLAISAPSSPASKQIEFDLTISELNTTTKQTEFLYPNTFTFPLNVQLHVFRDSLKGDSTVEPSVKTASARLSPKSSPTENSAEGSNYRNFAESFEAACPGLHLAISRTRKNIQPGEPDPDGLYIVQLGDNGVKYNVQEIQPMFFSSPPVSNSLSNGEVLIDTFDSTTGLGVGAAGNQRFDTIDLNVLARDFLLAVEDFLSPEQVVNLYALANADDADTETVTNIEEIIKLKQELANIIASRIEPILQSDNTKTNGEFLEPLKTRIEKAALKLQQALAIDLVYGYDIETIVQYPVSVSVKPGLSIPSGETAPRIAGKPRIKSLKRGGTDASLKSVDFSLSASKISLTDSNSYLTFLFNTQSPEKYEDIELEMVFDANDLEYNIEKINGPQSYDASDWLTFIIPLSEKTETFKGNATQNPNELGKTRIPIPLRYYPTPPSLISQRAVVDESSEKVFADIRQWEYEIKYEHPDVAQDSILIHMEANQVPKSSNLKSAVRSLFEELMNFSKVYPTIQTALNDATITANTAQRIATIKALKTLMSQVKTSWNSHNITDSSTSTLSKHYRVEEKILIEDEKEIKEISIHKLRAEFPNPYINLPAYENIIEPNSPSGTTDTSISYQFRELEDSEALLDTGDSSIPDRTLSIPDWDIINTQNLWAKIWLERNQFLIEGIETNPVFIFRTPFVQFNSPVTPLLINETEWDIADLRANTNVRVNLETHINNMFQQVLPSISEQDYSIRIACRYGFAMAEGSLGSKDLNTYLPVLMGVKFDLDAGDDLMTQSSELRNNLCTSLENWLNQNAPLRNKGLIVFSISIFSGLKEEGAADGDPGNLPNMPLLKIEHLGLKLVDIESVSHVKAG